MKKLVAGGTGFIGSHIVDGRSVARVFDFAQPSDPFPVLVPGPMRALGAASGMRILSPDLGQDFARVSVFRPCGGYGFVFAPAE